MGDKHKMEKDKPEKIYIAHDKDEKTTIVEKIEPNNLILIIPEKTLKSYREIEETLNFDLSPENTIDYFPETHKSHKTVLELGTNYFKAYIKENTARTKENTGRAKEPSNRAKEPSNRAKEPSNRAKVVVTYSDIFIYRVVNECMKT